MTPSRALIWPRGCWPDETQRLLLKACFLKDDDDCLAAWDEWQRRVPLDFVDGSSARLLLPLRDRLRRVARTLPRMPRIEGVVRFHWAQTQLTQRAIGDVLDLLEEAGIESILLKGAALSETVYSPGLRPMADIDILVRPRHVDDALALLQKSGWQPRFACHKDARKFTHALQLDNSDHRSLDLHWDPFHDRFLDEHQLESFWEASLPISVQGRDARVLCPADQLLQICEHGVRYDDTPPFRWLGDAFSIVEKLGDTIDWQRCTRMASKHGLLPQLQDTLLFLRNELRLELPGESAEVLNSGASPGSRLAYRISTRHQPGYHPVIQGLPRSLLAYARYLRSSSSVEKLGLVRFLCLINDIEMPPSRFIAHFFTLTARSCARKWQDRREAAQICRSFKSSTPRIYTLATTSSHLLDGFYPPEMFDGCVFRWTYPDATVRLKLDPGDYWIQADLLIQRDWSVEKFQISFNRQRITEVEGFTDRILIRVPEEAFVDHDVQRLVLRCGPWKTVKSRQLGFALVRLVVSPCDNRIGSKTEISGRHADSRGSISKPSSKASR
ncbi:MAG: nucleotidyltransferase family protein [Verrucomicrobiales bacterium]|nr:nucleotidyltransferase family protein [Verrucomicrobiales bacterium]